MTAIRRLVVIHTAFLGDIVLALPMVQVLKRSMPNTSIAFVAIPASCAVLQNHPGIDRIIEYDKKGKARGVRGFFSCVNELREFDAAIVPHRSLRSALLPFLAGIKLRIGFSTSAGSFLFTNKVKHESQKHEILRNLGLLKPLGIDPAYEPPLLYPSAKDRMVVEQLLGTAFPSHGSGKAMVAVAPGSVWNTKRWPEEYFGRLIGQLRGDGRKVVLLGGSEDSDLCERLRAGNREVFNAAGKLTVLQSADLIRRSDVLVSNDSAPMHLGVSMGTPVLAIFGATVPEFGFAPVGEQNRIHQTDGLACRPCSIHGGDRCPIGTFECMLRITPEQVFQTVVEMLHHSKKGGVSHDQDNS